jgi:lysozyme
MTPFVIDISHHNVGPLHGGEIDFNAIRSAGIVGVICKASEGSGYGDPTYADRRVAIESAGLKHGAYHFNTGEAVAAQIDRFFREADPSDKTLMVLDFEKQTVAAKGDMSVQQMVAFLRQVEARLGRKAAIYSGNRLRENIAKLDAEDQAYVTSHRLWHCQYGPKAVLPKGFSKYWLWQYAADGFGPLPHGIKGVNGLGTDMSTYQGTADQLAAEWA